MVKQKRRWAGICIYLYILDIYIYIILIGMVFLFFDKKWIRFPSQENHLILLWMITLLFRFSLFLLKIYIYQIHFWWHNYNTTIYVSNSSFCDSDSMSVPSESIPFFFLDDPIRFPLTIRILIRIVSSLSNEVVRFFLFPYWTWRSNPNLCDDDYPNEFRFLSFHWMIRSISLLTTMLSESITSIFTYYYYYWFIDL